MEKMDLHYEICKYACEKSVKDKTTVSIYGNMIEKSVGESMTETWGFHNKENSAKKKHRTQVMDWIIVNAAVNSNGDFVGVSRKSVKRIYLGGVKGGVNVKKVRQHMVDKKVYPRFVQAIT